ncbi:MAG: tyrosine-type recombinase/integrase [Nanoarchaeota archaeon]
MQQETNPEIRTSIYFKTEGVFERQNTILNGRTRTYNRQEAVWKGSERNKELIRAFQQHLFAKGSKQYRVGKLTQNLRLIVDFVQKDLDKLTKTDAEAFLSKVNQRKGWSPHTRHDYTRNFKQFLLWFEDEDPRFNKGDEGGRQEARKLYQYIKKIRGGHPRTTLDYATIITDEDCRLLLNKGCRDDLERALIAVLHETGARAGELLGMRLRDIEHKNKHALIRVDGKTGERRIPILQSIPYLERWLTNHPAKDNPNALLWISTHNGHRGEPLRHIGLLKLLKRAMKRSGINKKCNPHWFRHSRATIYAPKYGEQVLCKVMGWVGGSAMVRTYVHLGAQQVEDAFLKNNGLAEPEKPEQQVQFCVCGSVNEPGRRYCGKCGNALSVGIMLDDEQKKTEAIDEAFELLHNIMQNPDLRAKFEAFKKK